MSNTRTAEADAPLSQERYMSSPEYAELRGLSGTAVAAKAALCGEPRISSLLFFLQALSLRPGGLKKLVAELLATFADRIGTPAMHKFGMKPGQIYRAEQVRIVRDEVETGNDLYAKGLAAEEAKETGEPIRYQGKYPLKGECDATSRKQFTSYPAAAFVEACREELAWGLEHFLVDLCIDPTVRIRLPDGGASQLTAQQFKARERYPRLSGYHFNDASRPDFRDIIGALLEYKASHQQAARASFTETEVSKRVFRTLERGLRSRKIVVVNGVEGIGKSFSAEQFCECHLGESRFVRLRGNQGETTFYSAVWIACGLGSPVNRTARQLRGRVDRFIEQSGMNLVIDEAHRILPQSQRIYAQPALMNWLYGLWDIHVPVALLVTPQFASRLDEVERQTDWRSGQFKRRVDCWENLPDKLCEDDLRAVARSRAPAYTARLIDELVDFALPARRQLDAITRAISAAEFIASENGRQSVTARDLQSGIEEATQTDMAMTTKLDVERQTKGDRGRSRRRRGSVPAEALQDARSATAALLEDTGNDTFADMEAPSRVTNSRGALIVPA